MIAQHTPFARTLASSWLLRLALIAALAALLAASSLAPLAAHAITSGSAFSASHAAEMYGGPHTTCSSYPVPC